MFEKISIHTTRQFVPTDLNTGDWTEFAPLFEQLEKQLSEELGYRKVAGEDVEELELIVIAVRRCLNGSF